MTSFSSESRSFAARLVVDPGDDGGGEVQDLLEFLRRHVQQVADAAGHALEEPDVADGRGQVDVAHALAAHLRARDLHAAALAHDALVADALVLAAVALPVLRGTEDALAEEPVLLGLERAVVDGLRLGDLAGAPAADLLGGREGDLDCVEVIDVDHLVMRFRSRVNRAGVGVRRLFDGLLQTLEVDLLGGGDVDQLVGGGVVVRGRLGAVLGVGGAVGAGLLLLAIAGEGADA